MFFKAMPKISYKTGDKTILTKDIFRRVGLDRKKNNKLAVNAYYIKDGETPDMLANNFYGSSKYHWILLIVNDIVSVNEEWPKNQELMFTYTESKYGIGNASLDHHYRLTSDISIIVDHDAAAITAGTIEAVSNLDYELQLNEEKRQIFVLKPEFLAEFIVSYKSLMAQ
jgi:hypothetical protein